MISLLNKIIINPFLAVLAPRYCEVCNNLISDFSHFKYICQKCIDSLPLAEKSDLILNHILRHINKEDIYFDEAFSLISIKENNEYMNLIYNLKYKGLKNIGTELGALLGQKVEIEAEYDYEIGIPLPIHKAKQRERGYNQSDLIAKSASNELEIQFDANLVKRKIYTKSQTLVNKSERRKNVNEIFDLSNESVNFESRNVIIFDDVLTTGATLNSLSKLLKEYGANKVAIASLVTAL